MSEEETWHKQTMYGAQDTVLWAIIEGENAVEGRVIGSALLEADADTIISDHQQAQQVETLRAALGQAEVVIDAAFTIIGRENEEDEPDERSAAWMTKANESTRATRAALAAISGKETT